MDQHRDSAAAVRRPYIDKVHPEVYRALNGAARAGRTACGDAGVPRSLTELVNVRVSQINGCPTCLSIHVPAAKRAGVPDHLLDMLPSWRQEVTGAYGDRERAALGLAEALTRPGDGAVSVTRALSDARRVFTEQQVSALEWVIVLINAYNRVSIGSGHPPMVKRPMAK